MPDVSHQSPGTLIIVGQPPAELADFCILGRAGQTFVVEPDPVLAATVETSGVQVISAAPWTGKRSAELTTFNFPSLRSLCAPTEELKQLLPGLEESSKITVESISLEDLTSAFGEAQQPVDVIINLPGSEGGILDFWLKSGFLEKISLLDVACSVERFFEKGAKADEVHNLLTDNGFDLFFRNDDDPDWPRLIFHANPLKRELAALHRKLEAREVALGSAKAKLEEQTKAVNSAQSKASQAETEVTKLRKELTAREDALAAAKAQAEEQSQAITAAHNLAEKLRAENIQQGEALQGAKEDLSIALRMQTVLQADLSDMRQRFGKSERERQLQEALLRKLTPRLQQAAEQIRYLCLSDEEPEVTEASGDAK